MSIEEQEGMEQYYHLHHLDKYINLTQLDLHVKTWTGGTDIVLGYCPDPHYPIYHWLVQDTFSWLVRTHDTALDCVYISSSLYTKKQLIQLLLKAGVSPSNLQRYEFYLHQ